MFGQIQHEQCLVQSQSKIPPIQPSQSNVVYDEGEELYEKTLRMKLECKTRLTHGNPINLRVVSFVVIMIECFFPKSKGSTDSLRVLEISRD